MTDWQTSLFSVLQHLEENHDVTTGIKLAVLFYCKVTSYMCKYLGHFDFLFHDHFKLINVNLGGNVSLVFKFQILFMLPLLFPLSTDPQRSPHKGLRLTYNTFSQVYQVVI